MNDSMDVLRNTLLVSLIVILTYILYKRLISFLNRGNLSSENYAHIPRFSWKENVLRFELELPGDQNVIIELGEEGSFHELQQQKMVFGKHSLEFPLSELAPGKKTCRIITETNRIERFFVVK
jgi:hypothetical protein